MTVRHLLDVVVAACALVALLPLFAVMALGIRVSSKGPVFYRARRVGQDGKLFTMYKFRTMDPSRATFSSTITTQHDPRIFPFGALLRKTKIDELPQLLNILKGDMAFVGPRAEDPDIVRDHYDAFCWETLQVLPGLASPGSIYNYTHGEWLLKGDDSEKVYIEQLLPLKIALDVLYTNEASFLYDIKVILRAAFVITAIVFGKQDFSDPPEMEKAKQLLARRTTENANFSYETREGIATSRAPS